MSSDGDVTWYLGKALVETGRDRKRGFVLVEESRRLATEHQYKDLIEEIDSWRTTHPN